MKLQAENPNNVLNTNFETEDTREFGIKDPSFIIELLSSGFYSYPIRTLVQEYIANGRDATREIGANTPLTIRVPTRMESTFVLRDYGVGLSPDRMNEVFLNYGSSTKRDTNGQIGGFGIGGKSALAYTDEFDIIAYFDGMKRHYNVFRACDEETGKDKVKLDLISEEPTTEPNGTEIVVAVDPSDIRKFQDAIYRATYFADITPNYIGIDESDVPEQIEFLTISDNLKICDKNETPDCLGLRYADKLVLLIDGVVYPVSREMIKDFPEFIEASELLKDRQIMIYSIGNGIVKLSGSREDIKESKVTRRALQEIAKEILDDVNSHIDKTFPYTETIEERIKAIRDVTKNFKMPSNHPKRNFGIYHIKESGSYYSSDQFVKFDGIDYFKCQDTHYDSSEKRYRSDKHLVSIHQNDFGKLFFDDLGETVTPRNKNRRIKHAICVNGLDEVKVITPVGHAWDEYIDYELKDEKGLPIFEEDGVTKKMGKRKVSHLDPVPPEFFEQLKKDLRMKPLSSLEEPPKVESKAKTAEKRSKEKFCLTTLTRGGKRREWVTMADNEQKYVYALMRYNAFPQGYYRMKALSKYIEENTDYKLCGLNKENIKRVEKAGDTNFIHVDEFLKKHQPENIDQIYLSLFHNESKETYEDIIKKAMMLNTFKHNEYVREMDTLYKKAKKASLKELPTAVLEAWDINNKHPKVQELKMKELAYMKYLKRKIPITLLSNIDKYNIKRINRDISKMFQGEFNG